jgi:hypothetical protein
MKVKDIESQIGTLSVPSKMPCFAYSIPAKRCKQGSQLRKVKGSTCASCYALKGNYSFSNVTRAMEKRYQGTKKKEWSFLISELIRKKEKSGYFRWHDSGDIQSVAHLKKICDVALRLSHIQFWIPTRELRILKQFFDEGNLVPDNLTIRVSSFFVDSEFSKKPFGLVTSSVTTDKEKVTCPAPKQGNACLSCRKCWDKSVDNVAYYKH